MMFSSLQNIILNKLDENKNRFAIYGEEISYTYSELKENSLNIAAYLLNENIKNSCVYIQSENVYCHITALIGVLLSGNYYASITPENRSEFLNDNYLQAKCILLLESENSIHNSSIERYDIRNIITSSIPFQLDDLPFSSETQPFCAFMTSGSMGSPKIVVHSIKNILQDTFRQIKSNKIDSNDVFDHLFSFSFSASLATIFPALFSGAVIAPFNIKGDGIIYLKDFWKKNSVTFSTQSVSVFRTICHLNDSFKDCGSIRFISIGAEPVIEEDLDLFFDKFSSETYLQVAYASTETRTASEYIINKSNKNLQLISSIGRPVEGKNIIILSEDGTELPKESVGEIVVESEFIADEYFNDSYASNESFEIENGLVRYKTGDIGFIDEYGLLHYSGRKQHEIKIHGQKIDLYSIEKMVKMSSNIKEAAAVINMSNKENPTISLFTCSKKVIDLNEIKNNLMVNLPLNYLPNSYISVKNMPRTHTGKIDRKKLETLAAERKNQKNTSINKNVDTGNLTEAIINIWKENYSSSNVNSETNFFADLGGDSLSAINAVLELEKRLNLIIPAHIVLSYQTPTNIAKAIKNVINKSLVSIVRVNGFDSKKKTICFINYQSENGFNHFISDELNSYFNLVDLSYDLYGAYFNDHHSRLIIEKMKELLIDDHDVILFGYSFNGFIAHQLSAISDNILTTVMLDTPNYFEYDNYLISRQIKSINKIFFRDFKKNYIILLLGKIKRFVGSYLKHIILKKPEPNTLHRKCVNKVLNELSYKKSRSHCFFVKSNLTCFLIFSHGINWKKYFIGKFQIIELDVYHHQILEKKPAEEILKGLHGFMKIVS